MSGQAVYLELTDSNFRTLLNSCIHCGLCMQACPTYAVFGTEMDSPRGRIRLMRGAAEGRFGLEDFNKSFTKHINLCLSCLACQTACPSGVKYSQLIETVKLTIAHHHKPGTLERFMRWLGFRQMMPHVNRLKFVAYFLWLYQSIGLQKLVRALNFLPGPLKTMEGILPPIVPKYRNYSKPALAIGEKRGTVAFFIGCIQEAFLSSVNEATIRVLQRNGYEVHFPKGQTCCGAAQLHFGEDELAKELARKNIDAFEKYDVVINNAGGCGATLKTEYFNLFHDDPIYLEKTKQLSDKVKDISEFLIDHLHVQPTGKVKFKVTYSDSCHLRHAQKVINQPRDLLKGIPGLELIEIKAPDRCCGSAGVYNIIYSDTANQILDMKMADIASTGADLILASNTGCHMQLWNGVQRAKLKSKVVHVIEVLDMSYRAMDGKERQR
jgi:glycolate oxidase iron-sulfur subunit